MASNSSLLCDLNWLIQLKLNLKHTIQHERKHLKRNSFPQIQIECHFKYFIHSFSLQNPIHISNNQIRSNFSCITYVDVVCGDMSLFSILFFNCVFAFVRLKRSLISWSFLNFVSLNFKKSINFFWDFYYFWVTTEVVHLSKTDFSFLL